MRTKKKEFFSIKKRVPKRGRAQRIYLVQRQTERQKTAWASVQLGYLQHNMGGSLSKLNRISDRSKSKSSASTLQNQPDCDKEEQKIQKENESKEDAKYSYQAVAAASKAASQRAANRRNCRMHLCLVAFPVLSPSLTQEARNASFQSK